MGLKEIVVAGMIGLSSMMPMKALAQEYEYKSRITSSQAKVIDFDVGEAGTSYIVTTAVRPV